MIVIYNFFPIAVAVSCSFQILAYLWMMLRPMTNTKEKNDQIMFNNRYFLNFE